MATRGFIGRRPTPAIANRLPPGQFETDDFPVLSKGASPRIDMATWRFTLSDGPRPLKSWSWHEFMGLPRTAWQGDIHCVTTWSKFDTRWEGVTIDDLLTDAGVAAPTPWLLALSLDDYDTNVPVADVLGGRAMIATHFDGHPLAPQHGGRPACWYHTCTSGKARSGSRDLNSPRATKPGTGSCVAITCTAIPGGSNAIRTIPDGGQ